MHKPERIQLLLLLVVVTTVLAIGAIALQAPHYIAREAILRVLKTCHKSEIALILGKPYKIEHPLNFLKPTNEKAGMVEDWIYSLGSNSTLVLFFQQNRCVQAELYDSDHFSSYKFTIGPRIIDYMRRRSSKEVMELFGPPDRITKLDQWNYHLPNRTDITISFMNDRCLSGFVSGNYPDK